MNNLDIEKKLSAAMSHAVPDVLDNILSLCDTQGEYIMLTQNTTTKNKSFKKYIIGIAAAFAVMTGLTAFGMVDQGYINGFTVDIDVNPSIELRVNHAERIVAATALNPDAEKILDGMNLKNTDMDVAVNAIMGSMLEKGYIDELANSVLITVEGSNSEKDNALCQKLTQEVEATLKAQAVNAAVLSQTITSRTGKDLKDKAAAENISVGRAELINQLIAQNSNLKFDDLAKLTVNELNLLVNNDVTKLPNVSTTGTPGDKGYIGQENALQLALKHLNLTPGQISNPHFTHDYDNGKMEYDLEFLVGDKKYEFDIDAASGQILDVEQGTKDTDAEIAAEKAEEEAEALEDAQEQEEDAKEDAADKAEEEADALRDAQEKAEDAKKDAAEKVREDADALRDAQDEERDAKEDAADDAEEKSEALKDTQVKTEGASKAAPETETATKKREDADGAKDMANLAQDKQEEDQEQAEEEQEED
ncbi:MAG: hypothetical protein RR846_02175 [Oscillospiraceae bacterium]